MVGDGGRFRSARCSADGYVPARRDEGAHEAVRITVSRLLARRDDGQGRYFQFLGWSSRHYRTQARVLVLEDQMATLIVPEWHPTRPVPVPSRLLPEPSRMVGAWLTLSADLSAPVAGKLGLTALLPRSKPSGIEDARFV